MNPKLAIVTQSYRGDLTECELLCESIDRFVDRDIPHYIFVNDEDYQLFKISNITDRHVIRRKSEILPKYWLNFPFIILGHKYFITPLTIPVREWIIQQICKLGVFGTIDASIEAVMNIDSETVFMRPFRMEDIYKADTKEFVFFKEPFREEPCHYQYCEIAKKLCNLKPDTATLSRYCYMTHPVVFVRNNLQRLLDRIRKGSWRGWKDRLGNTYRFSEYYLYGLFTDYELKMEHHYLTEKHLFPLVDIGQLPSKEKLKERINDIMSDKDILGVWLQKAHRNDNPSYIPHNEIEETIHEYWEQHFPQ